MKYTSKKLFTLAAFLAATSFGSSAANQYEYFVGIDAGARISGETDEEYDGVKSHEDLSSSVALGLRGGVTLNQKHQFSLGYDYRGTSVDNSNSDLEVGTLYTRYDYLIPITQKLSWTIGGKLGYEMYNADDDVDDLDGAVLGAQTGLNYRFNDWSVGTEVSYLYHVNELEYEWDEYNGHHKATSKIGDEVLLMANIQYHF
ncbi:outer membrane beta-barrel protein [Vibrio ostreicida]|uniref:Outer membrane beta-barrel protein n=1 Tax=Vibrio ostreicida TaxID=526588 RepID=A0ABT8BRB0_9VIBR|nr:outer membrane beta-barrel protein [Vibrio ostreicida]MDN3609483.1 outer membrane beta-barrel protein [Vibrio ostreicida]NPD08363.1 outer membrane beta-barrel protein [Vibrio ostreicida]